MPDQDVITQMVSSPEFAKAPIAEQRKALAAHNPIFNEVGDADLLRFTKTHQMSAQANRIPTGAPSPAAVAQQELLNRPKPEFTSAPERFLQSALPAAGNMAVGLGKAALGGPYATAIQGIMQSWRDTKNPPSVQDLQGRATGIDANELGSQIQSGNYAGAAGSVAPTIAATLFGGRIAGKASKAALEAKVPNLAGKITDAVNPLPKKMASFQGTLNEQLPAITEHAQSAGVSVSDLKKPTTLAPVLRDAASAKHQLYYGKMLGPVKDATIDVSGIKSYDGPVQSAYPIKTATLGQLDSRLTQINATLSPKYEKGGMSAQAAVSAEQSAALKAEAAAIRDRLYKEIGSRNGIDPKVVAQTKNSFGALNNLAEQVELSVSKSRFRANVARRELPGKIGKVIGTGVGAGAVFEGTKALYDALK